MSRIPAPVVKNGRIVTAESAVLQPTVPANGKVIIINPGHGGYNTKNGFFDPGTYSFIKKGNGKYAPLLEYEKMKKYGESVTEKLRAQGYAVVVMGSHYKTMSADNAVANLIQGLNNGTKCNKRYDISDIMFVSLHADSEPGSTGTGICYTPGDNKDVRLKDSLINSFNGDSWFRGKTSGSERTGLFVLNTSKNIPSVLVEVEYVNGAKSQNLDSSDFQRKFEDRLIAGINNYYGIGQ
jgi:N-acetylmuramoyl-L-alanine amidase